MKIQNILQSRIVTNNLAFTVAASGMYCFSGFSTCSSENRQYFYPTLTRVGKITCFCFNYNYNYSLKFSIIITVTQVQVIVIQLQFQLQLQWKDSQNNATNSLTYEASSFAYVNTVDLFCSSVSDLLKPNFSLFLFLDQSFFNFNFCSTNFISKQLSSMLLNSYRFQQHYDFS